MACFPFHKIDGTESEVDRLLVASDFEGVDAIIICGYANNLWSKIGTIDDEYVSISQEELDECANMLNSKQTYYWESYSFYEGYSVSLKEGVEKTDKLQKAVDAIRSLDTIFSLDYTCN